MSGPFVAGDRQRTAELVKARRPKALRFRADHLSTTVDAWERVFSWPALFDSFRADIRAMYEAADRMERIGTAAGRNAGY